MKRFLWMLLGLSMSLVQALPLQLQSQQLIDDHLPGAHVGFEVRDAETGKVLLARQAFDHFTPASSLKLMTAAAAVRGLSEDFKFKTTIWSRQHALHHHAIKGGIWWEFAGDPTFSHEQLISMVKALRKRGVKVIRGDVVVDGSHFKGRHYPFGWAEDSLPWGYSAPVTAEMVDHNAIYLALHAGDRLGDPVAIKSDKQVPFPVKIDADVHTVTQAEADSHCNFWVHSDWDNSMHFRGCWPLSSQHKRLHVAVLHPQLWVRKMIEKAFIDQGIVIKGKVRSGMMPKQPLHAMVQHESKSMPHLIKLMLKYSDNLMAESLLKTLGYRYHQMGSFAQGMRVREDLLSQWAGLNFSRSELYDGSGGSRYNMVTPHQMAKLMFVIKHDKAMQPVLQGLPIAGKDGTLAHRMQVFHLAKHVQAKTGSMRHVSSLTGTMQTHSGRVLVFSILMDRALQGVDAARFLQHELCDSWYHID